MAYYYFFQINRNLLLKMSAEGRGGVVADEMFPDGPGSALDFADQEEGVRESLFGASGLLYDLTANDKTVHGEFYNSFGDLFDDNDLS